MSVVVLKFRSAAISLSLHTQSQIHIKTIRYFMTYIHAMPHVYWLNIS
jgi:hypothetical protein